MTETSISDVALFVHDGTFINSQDPLTSYLDTPGIGILDQTGLSYFVDLVAEKDSRDPTTRAIDFTTTSAPSILLDNSFYSIFHENFSTLTADQRSGLFAIIDRLLFDSTAADSAEDFLTTNAATSALYVPGSASVSTTTATGTYYNAANPTGKSYTCPAYAIFTIGIASGNTTLQYRITAYADCATFKKDYPNTTITAIAPPVDYNTLLNGSLSGTMANMFTTAANSASLNYSYLSPAFAQKPATGYLTYIVSILDGVNTLSAPFNLLYKGAIPSQLQIRTALKNAVVNSGYGTAAQWQARIPSLFVTSRYYLIVPWDLTTALSDQTVYQNILTLTTLLTKVGNVMNSMDAQTIQANFEWMLASYDRIPIGIVPDLTTDTVPPPFASIYPSYQTYASTDVPEYNYMTADTKTFVQALSTILAIASGNSPANPTYPVITDKDLTYYSFTSGVYEFCVITKDTYTQKQNETTSS